MNSHFDQNQFKVRFETYLDQRIHKKPEHTQFPNQSRSQAQAQPIRVEHYYQDAWWYVPIPSWNRYPGPPSQTIIHNNHYYPSSNRNYSDVQGQGQMQKQKDKNKVGLDDILKGVFVGSILVG